MARGHPALWSVLVSVPFFAAGAALYFVESAGIDLSGLTIPAAELQLLGIPFLVFGAFICSIGLYIQLVAAPAAPRLQDDEELVVTRLPSQRVALSKILVGIPALAIAGYLLVFTMVPYVYPTIALIIGLVFFSSGLKTYWSNTLTSYAVTNRRVIKDYRFLALRRQEIPLSMIRGVEERKSVTEAIVGLGNIQVASGGGGGAVRIIIQNIGDSTGFSDELRDLMR